MYVGTKLPTTLFNDGVHHIFTFLTTQEWNNALLTSHHWYNLTCKTEPVRRITITPNTSQFSAAATSSLFLSPLRRHVTALSHSRQSEEKLNLHRCTLAQFYAFLKELPHLTSAEVQFPDYTSLAKQGTGIDPHLKLPSSPSLLHLNLHERNDVTSKSPVINELITQLTTSTPQLRHLELTSSELLEINLAPLSTLKQLGRLDLTQCAEDQLQNYGSQWSPKLVLVAIQQLIILGTADFAHIKSISYVVEGNLMHHILAHPRWTEVTVPHMHHISPLMHLDHGSSIAGKLARAFPQLRSLNTSLLDGHTKDLLQLQHLESLSLLSLEWDEYGARDTASEAHIKQSLTTIRQLANLTHLHFGFWCNDITAQSWQELFVALPQLTSLGFSLNQTESMSSSSSVLEILCQVAERQDDTDSDIGVRLHSLTIENNHEMTYELLELMSERLSQLRRLMLKNCRVYQRSMDIVRGGAPHHEALFNECVRYFDNLDIMPRLEYLSFYYDSYEFEKYFVWNRSAISKQVLNYRRSSSSMVNVDNS